MYVVENLISFVSRQSQQFILKNNITQKQYLMQHKRNNLKEDWNTNQINCETNQLSFYKLAIQENDYITILLDIERNQEYNQIQQRLTVINAERSIKIIETINIKSGKWIGIINDKYYQEQNNLISSIIFTQYIKSSIFQFLQISNLSIFICFNYQMNESDSSSEDIPSNESPNRKFSRVFLYSSEDISSIESQGEIKQPTTDKYITGKPHLTLIKQQNHRKIVKLYARRQLNNQQYMGPRIVSISEQQYQSIKYKPIKIQEIKDHFQTFSFTQLKVFIVDILINGCEISARYIQHMDHDFTNMVYKYEEELRRYGIIDYDKSVCWKLERQKQKYRIRKQTSDLWGIIFQARHLKGEKFMLTQQEFNRYTSHIQINGKQPCDIDYMHHKRKAWYLYVTQQFRSCYDYDLLKRQGKKLTDDQKKQAHLWISRMFFQEHDFQELLRLIFKVISIIEGRDTNNENRSFEKIMKIAKSNDLIQNKVLKIAQKIKKYYSLSKITVLKHFGKQQKWLKQQFNIKFSQIIAAYYAQRNPLLRQFSQITIVKLLNLFKSVSEDNKIITLRPFMMKIIQDSYKSRMETMETGLNKMKQYKLKEQKINQISLHIVNTKQQFQKCFQLKRLIQTQFDKQKENIPQSIKYNIPQQEQKHFMNYIKFFYDTMDEPQQRQIQAFRKRICNAHHRKICKYFIVNLFSITIKSKLPNDRYLCPSCLQQFQKELRQNCKIIDLSLLSRQKFSNQKYYEEDQNILKLQELRQLNEAIKKQTIQFLKFTQGILQLDNFQEPIYLNDQRQFENQQMNDRIRYLKLQRLFHDSQQDIFQPGGSEDKIQLLKNALSSEPLQKICSFLDCLLNKDKQLNLSDLQRHLQWLKIINERDKNIQSGISNPLCRDFLLPILKIVINDDILKQIFQPLVKRYQQQILKIKESLYLQHICESISPQNINKFNTQQEQEMLKKIVQFNPYENSNIQNKQIEQSMISNKIGRSDYRVKEALFLENDELNQEYVNAFVNRNQSNLKIALQYVQELSVNIVKIQQQFIRNYINSWQEINPIIKLMVNILNMNHNKEQKQIILRKFIVPNQLISHEENNLVIINYHLYQQRQIGNSIKRMYHKMILKKIQSIKMIETDSINQLIKFNRNFIYNFINVQIIGKNQKFSDAIFNEGKIQFEDIQNFRLSLQQLVKNQDISNKIRRLQITQNNKYIHQQDERYFAKKIQPFRFLQCIKCQNQQFTSHDNIDALIDIFPYLNNFQFGKNQFDTNHVQKLIKNFKINSGLNLDIFNLSRQTIRKCQLNFFGEKSPRKTHDIKQSQIQKFILDKTEEKGVKVNLDFIKIHPGVMLKVLATDPKHFTFIIHNRGGSAYFRQLHVLELYISKNFSTTTNLQKIIETIKSRNTDSILYSFMIKQICRRLKWIETLDIYFENYNKALLTDNNFIFKSILEAPIVQLRNLILSHIQIPEGFNRFIGNNPFLCHLQINNCINLNDSFFQYLPAYMQHLILRVGENFFGKTPLNSRKRQYAKLNYEKIKIKKLTQLVITIDLPINVKPESSLQNLLQTLEKLQVLILHGWLWINGSIIQKISKIKSLKFVSVSSKLKDVYINPLLALPNIQKLSFESIGGYSKLDDTRKPFFTSKILKKINFCLISSEKWLDFIQQIGDMPNLTQIIFTDVQNDQQIQKQFQPLKQRAFKNLRLFRLSGKNIFGRMMPNKLQ